MKSSQSKRVLHAFHETVSGTIGRVKASQAAALAVLVLLFFQNCSPARFVTHASQRVSSASLEDVDTVDGNGNGTETPGGNPSNPPGQGPGPTATPGSNPNPTEHDDDDDEDHEDDHGDCDDDDNPNDPDYDDDDAKMAAYERVYHRLMTGEFARKNGASETFRFDRLISLDDSNGSDVCRFNFEMQTFKHSRSRERIVDLKFCSGYLKARDIAAKVGSCTPSEVVLRSKSNSHVTISRKLVLDADCLCHFDRELTFARDAEKGLVTKTHLRQRFANPDACADHFPEWADAESEP